MKDSYPEQDSHLDLDIHISLRQDLSTHKPQSPINCESPKAIKFTKYFFQNLLK